MVSLYSGYITFAPFPVLYLNKKSLITDIRGLLKS